jgi:hypothetical protein
MELSFLIKKARYNLRYGKIYSGCSAHEFG